MRNLLVVVWAVLFSITSASAQLSVGIGLPGVSIGINLPVYPQLVPVPGYPVYYAPQVSSNYFFYDGMYWVFQRDNWYASSWYNGPWGLVAPEAVPLFVLRIPVRYYRHPPVYFRGWQSDAPPRWGEHWGNSWVQRRQGVGQLGSQCGVPAGSAAGIPASIFRNPLSARRAAAGAAEPALPIPAPGCRRAAALSGAAGAACGCSPGEPASPSGEKFPAAGAAATASTAATAAANTDTEAAAGAGPASAAGPGVARAGQEGARQEFRAAVEPGAGQAGRPRRGARRGARQLTPPGRACCTRARAGAPDGPRCPARGDRRADYRAGPDVTGCASPA